MTEPTPQQKRLGYLRYLRREAAIDARDYGADVIVAAFMTAMLEIAVNHAPSKEAYDGIKSVFNEMHENIWLNVKGPAPSSVLPKE